MPNEKRMPKMALRKWHWLRRSYRGQKIHYRQLGIFIHELREYMRIHDKRGEYIGPRRDGSGGRPGLALLQREER